LFLQSLSHPIVPSSISAAAIASLQKQSAQTFNKKFNTLPLAKLVDSICVIDFNE
jgi:hypothetical protein